MQHPNIVKYHGFVKTPDTLNIILEYVPVRMTQRVLILRLD
jgi:hypothetical protein